MSKHISHHAAAAKAIRAELKKHGVAGTVRASSYSGGSSVTVTLTDELPATVDAVRAFAGQFQYGHFDGMTDGYEYSNSRDDIPQVRFVFVQNEISEARLASAWNYCLANHADCNTVSGFRTYSEDQILSDLMSGRWGTWLADQKPRAAA